MNKKTFLACLLLLLPFCVFAADYSVNEAELASYKELNQARTDALKESVQKDIQVQTAHIEAQDKRIDQQDKLLDSFSARIGDLSIFLTIFGLVAGLLGYFTVSSRAREEAQKAADRWFEEKGMKTKADAFEVKLAESHESISKLTKQVEELAARAGKHIVEIENSTRRKADETMGRLQEEISRTPEKIGKTGSAEAVHTRVESGDDDALEKMEQAARSKPEIEYDYNDWNARAFYAWNKNDFDGAARYWRSAASVQGATNAQAASSLYNAGVALGRLNRSDEEIAVYDEVVSRYDSATEAALREQVVKALVNKGITLGQLNRSAEELAVYDEVLSRYGSATEAALRERVAKALFNKGITLGQLNRSEEEIAVYDEVFSRYGSAPEAALREVVANALVNKGFTLGQLNRSEEEIAVYDEVLSRYGNAPEGALREVVAKVLVNKGSAFGQASRIEEAMAVFDEVVSRYGSAPEVTLREVVAKALLNKGSTFGQLNRSEEAIAVYDEVVSRYGSAPESALRELVANALNGKGFALLCRAKANWTDETARLGDLQAAASLLSRAESEIGNKPMTWGNQAYAAFLLGQPDFARPLLKQALQQGGEELYKDELNDLNTHPVPLDVEFRTLLKEIWEEVKPKA